MHVEIKTATPHHFHLWRLRSCQARFQPSLRPAFQVTSTMYAADPLELGVHRAPHPDGIAPSPLTAYVAREHNRDLAPRRCARQMMIGRTLMREGAPTPMMVIYG
ncbi:hypothetical protein [Nonomuraea sp. B19D2]|uniref:hypothetical protein n=1 Tax=Nonomuraea sp. B19D2 TaxID=3159561 RepID=UPI0032DB29A2